MQNLSIQTCSMFQTDSCWQVHVCVCVCMACVGDVCMWKANQHYHTSERRLILPFSRGSSPEVPRWSLQVTHTTSSTWKMQHLSQQHVAALDGKDCGKLVSFTPDFSNSLRRLILSSMGQINRFLSHRSPRKPLPGTLESSGKGKKCRQTYSRGRVGSSDGSLTTTHLCWWRTAGCLASWRGTGACFWPPTWSRWARWWTCCQDQLSEDGLTESWASLRRNERRGGRERRQGGGGGGGGERCSTDAGSFRGVVAVSLRACVRAYMCLHVR